MKEKVIVFGLIGIFLVFVMVATVKHANVKNEPRNDSVAVASAKPSQPTAQQEVSAWEFSSEENDVTKEVTQYAIAYLGRFVVRNSKESLDCFINTHEFLETVDNLDSRKSRVRYRFDDGPVVSQTWSISEDNTALFYPGKSCASFINKIKAAKKFYFEYQPADKIAQTISINIQGFPEAFHYSPEPLHPPAKVAKKVVREQLNCAEGWSKEFCMARMKN